MTCLRAAGLFLLAFFLAAAGARAAETQPDNWVETRWRGETAFTAAAGGWRAIVSVERGRLVYFGTADGRHNLLFATAQRDDPAGWGGHRVWLGPQATWPGGWPPPRAWEASAASATQAHGSELELVPPDAGEGWPGLRRKYSWAEGRLHCVAEVRGGSRPAQLIQIFQVPAHALVTAVAAPTPAAPRGYVQVHLGRMPSPRTDFPPPPQVSETAGRLVLRFNNQREKLGFRPQSLEARIDGMILRVSPGRSEGTVVSVPDDGFTTQVYLGGGASPLIELEQLSPRWAAASAARFEVVLDARAAE